MSFFDDIFQSIFPVLNPFFKFFKPRDLFLNSPLSNKTPLQNPMYRHISCLSKFWGGVNARKRAPAHQSEARCGVNSASDRARQETMEKKKEIKHEKG